MTRKTIITCAVTGGDIGSVSTGIVPVTAKEIAESAIGAWRAGAAIVHLHARNPETGMPSTDLSHYREAVDRIRDAGTDLIINLTTGPGARFKPGRSANSVDPSSHMLPAEDRVRHVLELRPEICTLDMGSLNFWDGVLINPEDRVQEMAELLCGSGVLTELEIFDSGQFALARRLQESGVIARNAIFQLVFGAANTAPATPMMLQALTALVPAGSPWAAFGVGRHSFPMVAQSYLAGGHVRVGIEDNLYLSKGKRTPDNASLVRKAVELLDLLGGEPATAAETRDLLGLSTAAG